MNCILSGSHLISSLVIVYPVHYHKIVMNKSTSCSHNVNRFVLLSSFCFIDWQFRAPSHWSEYMQSGCPLLNYDRESDAAMIVHRTEGVISSGTRCTHKCMNTDQPIVHVYNQIINCITSIGRYSYPLIINTVMNWKFINVRKFSYCSI